MPMGPFELLDEIGLDVAVYVLKSLARDEKEAELPPAMKQAMEKGWLGKKSGRGFYIHAKPKRGRKTRKTKHLTPNNELARLFWSAEPRHISAEEFQWRLVLPM